MARILLIDDDLQILKVITAILTKEQHEVTAVVDGRQGIKQMEARRFDLVMTDVIMPEEDGISLLMWLAQQAERPKVIAMSGGASFQNQYMLLDICKTLGADMILAKPLDLETVTNAVSEVLSRS